MRFLEEMLMFFLSSWFYFYLTDIGDCGIDTISLSSLVIRKFMQNFMFLCGRCTGHHDTNF